MKLLIGVLAVYRLALLFSEDTGPYRLFSRLRSFLSRQARESAAVRKSAIHKGIQCIRCDSIWMALPVAAYGLFRESIPPQWRWAGDGFLLMLALSAGAILVHRMWPEKG